MHYRLKKLVDDCKLEDEHELMNAAMTLFQWAVQEKQHGREIACYDKEKDFIEIIKLPALENVDVPNDTNKKDK